MTDWDRPINTAKDIADVYENHPELADTIGRHPYTFDIFAGATAMGCRIEQAIQLRYWTPHAWRHNTLSIGIALVGDWRRDTPTLGQVWGVVQLVANLLTVYPGAQVHPHVGTLENTTRRENHVCPGALLGWETIRDRALEMCVNGSVEQLPLRF